MVSTGGSSAGRPGLAPFAAELIKALEEAQAVSKQPKPADILASSAWEKLQYDFPDVTPDELAALESQWLVGTWAGKLTPRMLGVLCDQCAAPAAERRVSAPSTQGEPPSAGEGDAGGEAGRGTQPSRRGMLAALESGSDSSPRDESDSSPVASSAAADAAQAPGVHVAFQRLLLTACLSELSLDAEALRGSSASATAESAARSLKLGRVASECVCAGEPALWEAHSGQWASLVRALTAWRGTEEALELAARKPDAPPQAHQALHSAQQICDALLHASSTRLAQTPAASLSDSVNMLAEHLAVRDVPASDLASAALLISLTSALAVRALRPGAPPSERAAAWYALQDLAFENGPGALRPGASDALAAQACQLVALLAACAPPQARRPALWERFLSSGLLRDLCLMLVDARPSASGHAAAALVLCAAADPGLRAWVAAFPGAAAALDGTGDGLVGAAWKLLGSLERGEEARRDAGETLAECLSRGRGGSIAGRELLGQLQFLADFVDAAGRLGKAPWALPEAARVQLRSLSLAMAADRGSEREVGAESGEQPSLACPGDAEAKILAEKRARPQPQPDAQARVACRTLLKALLAGQAGAGKSE